MQAFTPIRKFRFILLALSVGFPVFLFGQEMESGFRELTGYLSGEAEDWDESSEKVFTYNQLNSLKKAVPPQYITIMDEGGGGFSRGILITFSGFRKKNVFLAGNFSNWNQMPMRRNSYDIFYSVIPVTELENGEKILNYEYKFLADGVWTHDPNQPEAVDDGLGGYYSLFSIQEEKTDRLVSYRILKEKESRKEKLIEFAIYRPETENMSLVGSFNDWNPEHDIMTKGTDGVFRLRKRLPPGEFYYKMVADGKWILDTFNPDTVHHRVIRDLVSRIRIPE